MGKNATRAEILAACTACGGPMPENNVRHTRNQASYMTLFAPICAA